MQSPAQNPAKSKLAADHITAMCTIRQRTLIRLNAKKEIQLVELKQICEGAILENGNWQNETLYTTRIKNSHEEGIKGIRVMPDLKSFMTWSGGGLLRIWNSDADCLSQFRVPLHDIDQENFPVIHEAFDEGVKNQLTAVASVSNGKILIVGDRFGLVRLINPDTEKVVQLIHAHGSEIVDIAYFKSGDPANKHEIFITSSRDRTVQIFSTNSDDQENAWGLLQTLTTHKSSVIKVLITQDCERIVSCSSDRTVAIHQAVYNGESQIIAYALLKVISLRSTPTDIFLDEISKTLVVSSSDKFVYIYNFPTGDLISSYKAMDMKGDSLVLHDLSVIRVPNLAETGESIKARSKQAYLVGIGNDKSIRVYEHPSGIHIGCEWGHSEGVSGLKVIKNTTANGEAGVSEWVLASSGYDGCVFLWSLKGLKPEKGTGQDSRSFRASDENHVSSSPIRKILSNAELTRLLKNPESKASVNLSTVSTNPGYKTTPLKSRSSQPSTPVPATGSPQTPRSLSVSKTRALRHSVSLVTLNSSKPALTPTDPRKKVAQHKAESFVTAPISSPVNTPSKVGTPRSVDRLCSPAFSNLKSTSASSVQRKDAPSSRSLSELKDCNVETSPSITAEPKKPYGSLRKQRSSRAGLLPTISSSSITKVEKSNSGSIYSTASPDADLSTRLKRTTSSGMRSLSRRLASLQVKVTAPPKDTSTRELSKIPGLAEKAQSGRSACPSPITSNAPKKPALTSIELDQVTIANENTSNSLTNINNLCDGLAQFRDQYRQNKNSNTSGKKYIDEQQAMERLKRELKQTLVLLEGTPRERVKVDELVELFGDRLVEMISSKIA